MDNVAFTLSHYFTLIWLKNSSLFDVSKYFIVYILHLNTWFRWSLVISVNLMSSHLLLVPSLDYTQPPRFDLLVDVLIQSPSVRSVVWILIVFLWRLKDRWNCPNYKLTKKFQRRRDDPLSAGRVMVCLQYVIDGSVQLNVSISLKKTADDLKGELKWSFIN